MSFRVVSEVLERSRADNSTDLAVLVAIAEVAHHDGIGFIQQGPADDPKSISFRSRNGVRTVERSIADCEWNLELEIRKAQRGRKRINVYRVISGAVMYVEPDYDRLPFVLSEPFSSPAEIEALRTTRHLGGWSQRPAADRLAGGHHGDDPPTATRRPAIGGGSVERSLNHPLGEASASPAADPAARGREERKLSVSLQLSADLGTELAGMTKAERRRWFVAIEQLLAAGATADQVRDRVAAYRRRWPDVSCTAWALVHHWSSLAGDIAAPVATLDRWIELAPSRFDRQTAQEMLDDRPGLDEATRAISRAKLDAAFDRAVGGEERDVA